jgi:hypothetical protein
MQFLLYIALYESKCILVGVALRLYFRREDIIRLYDTNGGTVTYRTNKNVDIYCTFVLKYKMKSVWEESGDC